MKKNDRNILKGYLKKNEGVRFKRYFDSKKIPTIGVGFNLTRPDAQAQIEKLKLNFKDVLNGKLKLNEKQVNALLDVTLSEMIGYANDTFGNFSAISFARQAVIVDMIFNLGIGNFKKFNKLISAINTNNWVVASKEILNSNYATDVKSRATKNAKAMKTGVLPFKLPKAKPKKEPKSSREPGRGEGSVDARGARGNKPDKPDKPEKPEKPEKPDKPDHGVDIRIGPLG
jgi:lysozyme